MGVITEKKEHVSLRIADLDPDEREEIELIIAHAKDHDAYLHIEVRKGY